MDASHPLLQQDEPPPFPASYPTLQRLDRVPLCPICKEYYKGPVSIACGHSFCSACIRSFLDVTKKCPSCHEPAKEGSIRRNRVLEEMTDAWEAARPGLIDLTQPSQAVQSRKRPRLSGSPRASRTASAASLEDSDIEEVELAEDSEANCPICDARVAISAMDSHIGRGCPPPKVNQKADWRKVFSGAGSAKDKLTEMKRIVKPNYSLIPTSELKGLLTEHGLPTTGDRGALESRFQEWTVLYNANLDTSHPSSLQALRAQLASSEQSRRRDREKGKEEEVEALKSKEGFVKHAREQKAEFERLKREIMARKRGAVDSPIEVE